VLPVRSILRDLSDEGALMDQHMATVWEEISDLLPEAIALEHGTASRTWREFEDRSARFAAAMLDQGVGAGDTVAICLFNCSEYLEAFFAALKIRAVPANVNYRYLGDELRALLGQLDTAVFIYSAPLRAQAASAVAGTEGLKLAVEVGHGGDGEPGDNVAAYEELLASYAPAQRFYRSPDDTFLSCTGGTTGLPKAVEVVIGRSVANTRMLGRQMLGLHDVDWEAPAVERALGLHRAGRSPVALPASPLMHSTGLIMASLPVLTAGGRVITLTSRHFDAEELWSTVERTRPSTLSIVGDAFARRMVTELERRAGEGSPYDTSSLVTITSAGVAWSAEVKAALLEHIPQVTLVDACGSSEGATIGSAEVRRGMPVATDRFSPAPGLRIIREDGTDILPGDSEPGMFLVPTVSRGYRKDPERTASSFRFLGDRTYVIPGDWGRWNDDGTITLVGRGTSVINTGGEKVFPEEVEHAIRSLGNVDDCVVLGRPDEEFGQRVCAVIQLADPGAESADQASERIVTALRSTIASYKLPRTLVFADVPRGPNGKMLHQEARHVLEEHIRPRAGEPAPSVR
jgi:3-oxocholest-4-en-26-oate---CoA ligase